MHESSEQEYPRRWGASWSEEGASALQQNSFCLINTGDYSAIQRAMDVAESRRFALSAMTKHFMSGAEGRTSCGEEGYVASTNKEMFHYTSTSGACQTPAYWYVPTAVGECFKEMEEVGKALFDWINLHVLKHLRAEEFRQDSFSSDSSYKSWIDACKNSDRNLTTSFLYHEHESDDLHTKAHVDRGLLTIINNPADLEILVKGRWIEMGSHHPPGTFVVLTGYTLERATGGIFEAACHRIRNRGQRRSRVFKLRLDPSLVLYPKAISACVSPSISVDLASELPTSITVEAIMNAFDRVYSSVNAPSPGSQRLETSENREKDPALPCGDAGMLLGLPLPLLFIILDQLRDLSDLSALSQTCRSMRRVATSEALCIPAAEASHIDWCTALESIDQACYSHARTLSENMHASSVIDSAKLVIIFDFG